MNESGTRSREEEEEESNYALASMERASERAQEEIYGGCGGRNED